MRDPNFFDRLDKLLDEALELDGEAQSRLLGRLTIDEPELASELRELLRHAGQVETFLALRAAESRDRMLSEAMALEALEPGGRDRVGETLGAYRIEEKVARGLRSAVYRARRIDEEWTQEVAIKVLTRGVDSDDVLRRFIAERQILTVLRHPNIASLLDGGITADGSPYFVMEYIEGLPVTEYCRVNDLSLAGRVRLCREICSAVAYAHRHLVVHRDLKPMNILVDQEGCVKLLDFGIAKLLGEEAATGLDPLASARTTDIARPMTPHYASPEQIQHGAITSATDVYQLGLLFTEILTGVKSARNALGIESDGQVRHRPSTLVGLNGATLPYSGRELRRDLDWILLKALEIRPEQRYASATGLGLDFQNYEESRPVRARRATAIYVLRKFVARRPVVAASLGLLMTAVIAFTVTLTYFNQQLDSERKVAVAAAERAEEVKNLLVSFIQSPDPFAGSGADARVSDVLARSEPIVELELSGRPELQAELYGVLGDVYSSLSLSDRALRMRELEKEKLIAAGDSDSFQLMQVERERAQAMKALGQLDESRVILERLRDELASSYSEKARERATVEIVLSNYHTVYGRPEQGLPYLERAVQLARQVEDDPEFLGEVIQAQAFGLRLAGRIGEAHEKYEQALETFLQNRDPEDPEMLLLKAAYSANLTNLGRYDESLRVYAEIVAPLEQRLGSSHREVLNILNNYAFTYAQAGSLERAAEIHRDILKRRQSRFGEIHRDVADSWQNIGTVLTNADRHDEALEALNQAAHIYPQVNQPGSPLTAYPHITMSGIYAKREETALQEEHASRAIDLLQGNVPEHHPALLLSRCLLGGALSSQDRSEEGIAMMQLAAEGLEKQEGRFQKHLDACRKALNLALLSRQKRSE